MPEQEKPGSNKPDCPKAAPPGVPDGKPLASGNGNPQIGPAEQGYTDPKKTPADKPWWRKIRWMEVINAFSAIVMAVATVFMAIIASNTQDIQVAIGTIAKLADQTKRQADNSDAEVKTLAGEFGEMQKQTRYFQTSATAAQGQLREMRNEQRPIVDVATIESIAPLQTDPVIGMIVSFNVVNSGKSVAILAYPHAKLILGLNIDVLKREKEACLAPVKNAAGNTRTGFNIRAGATMPISAGYALTAEETKAWKNKPEARTYLVGCISYMFDGKHHHSPFVEEVDRSDATAPDGWRPINPNTDKVDKGGLVFLIPPWYTAEPD